jgi:hypothetical protein
MDRTENNITNNSSIVVTDVYLAIARILLTRLFVSAGTCLLCSYLATAAIHTVTAQQRVYMPQYA